MYDIRKLKDRERGNRCFILANGPSINEYDLSKLKNEVTIGINASTLLSEKFDFTQSYYVVSDKRFFDVAMKKQLATYRLGKNTIKVFRKEIIDVYPNDIDNVYYVSALERDGFSFDLYHGYYYGCTTVMLAIQLASYLGIREIYLLGVDLIYNQENARFYLENEIQIDDSKSSVQIFNIVNADLAIRERGGIIYNTNPKSLIRNYLQFQDLNDLLG
ncbi:DUF115 domain-containing protein [Neisseria sp. 23W00296]|uniref:DUF115 domain-containing protein n=1 Tax=unclassified Neisseria TaxID=2623750 RepID=UPI0002A25981|nr:MULTISPECIES: DUF115 domain-containing protein [unclassified Neisseria]ASP16270.1 hypothetical protein CGZ77_00040 [Neisseria sp. KEM232]EKY09496.1 hypothetical protein HMPREF9120_00429 [Neisseria sp. oral taxon 020 str. F0370]